MSNERHNYEYEVDTNSQTAPANVVRLVGNKKRVLEIGCGPGSITKILAEQGGCQVTGLELDPEAIKKVTPYCVNVIQADLNASEWPRLLDKSDLFDVVVAADVLEHLYDPWETLKKMVPLIKPEGYIVISLPHIGHATVMACLFHGNFDYRNWGLLDRTHIRFFCLKNIEELFGQAKLKIIEVAYVVKHPEDTEFSDAWLSLPGHVKKAFRDSPYSDIYQVVVKAVPIEFSGKALSLTHPLKKLVKPKILYLMKLKSFISCRLSLKAKKKIRYFLGFLGVKV